jgi:glutaredoxin
MIFKDKKMVNQAFIKENKHSILYVIVCIALIGIGIAAKALMNDDVNEIKLGNYSEYGVTPETPIVVFARKGCPVCKELDDYFKALGIEYVKHYVDPHQQSPQLSLYRKLEQNVVPVILIQNKLIPGFQINKVEYALTELKQSTIQANVQ